MRRRGKHQPVQRGGHGGGTAGVGVDAGRCIIGPAAQIAQPTIGRGREDDRYGIRLTDIRVRHRNRRKGRQRRQIGCLLARDRTADRQSRDGGGEDGGRVVVRGNAGGVGVLDREGGCDGLARRHLMRRRGEHQPVQRGGYGGGTAGVGVDADRCIIGPAAQIAQRAVRGCGKRHRDRLGLAGVHVGYRNIRERRNRDQIGGFLIRGGTGDRRHHRTGGGDDAGGAVGRAHAGRIGNLEGKGRADRLPRRHLMRRRSEHQPVQGGGHGGGGAGIGIDPRGGIIESAAQIAQCAVRGR